MKSVERFITACKRAAHALVTKMRTSVRLCPEILGAGWGVAHPDPAPPALLLLPPGSPHPFLEESRVEEWELLGALHGAGGPFPALLFGLGRV